MANELEADEIEGKLRTNQLFRHEKKLMLMKGHVQDAECSRELKGTLARLSNGTITDLEF